MKKKPKTKIKSKNDSEEWEFFDDCEICQATKKATEHGRNLSLEELQTVFKSANAKQEGGSRTFIFETKLLGYKNISRTIAVLESTTLYDFAEIILSAYKFSFDHAFGFFSNVTSDGNYTDSEESYELFTDLIEEGEDLEPTGAGSVKHTCVNEVWQKEGDKMMLLFDYGDSWRFSVRLDEIGKKSVSKTLPLVLKSEGKAPQQYS